MTRRAISSSSSAFNMPVPEQVADVAAEAVDLLFRTIQRERWIAIITLPTPEARSEPGGQSPGPGSVPVGAWRGRTLPAASAPAIASLVRVALHLAERDRSLGDTAVTKADRVGRVLPALVDQAVPAQS